MVAVCRGVGSENHFSLLKMRKEKDTSTKIYKTKKPNSPFDEPPLLWKVVKLSDDGEPRTPMWRGFKAADEAYAFIESKFTCDKCRRFGIPHCPFLSEFIVITYKPKRKKSLN